MLYIGKLAQKPAHRGSALVDDPVATAIPYQG